MKIVTLAIALCLPIMAQNIVGGPGDSKPNPSDAVKAGIAAHIEQVRVFAVQAVADPSLIERTAKANRAKVLKGTGADAFVGSASIANHTAESLYQIQEDIGLDAAIRAAQLLANLPALPKGAM